MRAGLHAAGHAILNALPMFVLCNPEDAAVECVNEHETRYKPQRLLIFDKQPGGTGISAQASDVERMWGGRFCAT